MNKAFLSAAELHAQITGREPPIVVDVRRQAAFLSSTEMLGGAVRRDPEEVRSWSSTVCTAMR